MKWTHLKEKISLRCCKVVSMLIEKSEQSKSNKPSTQKKSRSVKSAYKNSKLFLVLFFLIIPSLYIPISFNPDVFVVVAIILSTVIGIFIFFNIQTVVSTLKGSKTFSTSDYHNVLSVIEWMPKIQIVSGVIIGISITGLISLSHIPTNPSSEFIRLLLFSMFIPSIVVVLFSTLHLILHPIGKNFDLDLSKTWIMSIESESRDSDKIKNLMNCIENYNDFLHKLLKKRMTNLDQLYVKFVLDTSKDLDTIIKEIKEKVNQREFFLLRYLQECKNDDGKTIIEIKPLKRALLTINEDKLKNISAIIGSVATIILFIQEILPIIIPYLKIT